MIRQTNTISIETGQALPDSLHFKQTIPCTCCLPCRDKTSGVCAVVQQEGKITNKVFQASPWGVEVCDVLLYFSKFFRFLCFL